MKKILNIVLCLGMLLQNFAFITPVFADDIDIIINKVTQGEDGTVLDYDGEYYLAPTFDDIKVSVELNPNSEYEGYYISVENGYHSNTTYHNGTITTLETYTDKEQEVNEYTVKVCDGWRCNSVVASKTIKVKFSRFGERENGRLYLTEVSQGGEVVEPNEYDGFELNDAQDITFKLKGENLVNDFVYELSDYSNITNYTGSELNAGITYVYKPEEYGYLGLNYSVAGLSRYVEYKKGNEFVDVYFNLIHDENIPSFSSNIQYTDYPSIEFEHIVVTYENNFTTIKNKYHNASHTLSAHIDGNNFENKNYSIKATVNGDDEEVYTRTFSVNGTLLNNGYNLELTGLNLANYSASEYEFNISVAGITKTETYNYETRTLTLTSLKQNNVSLSATNGVYQAPGFKKFYAVFDISDYDATVDDFYLRVNNNGSSYGTGYEPGEEFSMDLYLSSQESTYQLFLCDTYECDTLYAYLPIKINLVNYEDYQNEKIYISDVTQGGVAADFDTNDWTFNFNNKQDVRFRIYGENLVDDASYRIVINYNEYTTLLGSELEKGIDVVYPTNASGDDLSITFYLDDTYLNSYCYNDGINEYCNGTGYNWLTYTFDKEVEIPTYTGKLIYTNYKDIPITYQSYYYQLYNIDYNYHNQNNSLSYRINGTNFEDKNYQVSLKVTKNEEEYFTKTYSVNGLLLNNGYDLELTGLTLALRTDYTHNNEYDFEFSISDISTEIYTEYYSTGKSAYVSGQIYRNKDKQNLLTGSIWTDAGGMVIPLNQNYFANNTKLGVQYSGYNFVKNTNYNYIMEYGYITGEGENAKATYARTIDSGTVSGDVLNNNGLEFSLDNSANYANPVYRFTVKNGTEIVAYEIFSLDLTTAPTIVEATVRANGQDLVLIDTEEDYGYAAPRNKQVSFIVSGVGFENKDYEFNFCTTQIKNNGMNYDDYGKQICEKQTLKGSEINAGTAKLIFDKESAANVTNYQILISGSGFHLSNEIYLTLKMVDADEIVVSTGGYTITNDSEILKDVGAGTTYNELVNKIVTLPNYTVHVFDKTGNNEVNNTIGTGMILKILGDNNEVVMELAIAVKGDITGDGGISITDLVKVKRHLAGAEELSGIYEVAADVTDTGTVNLTDLINMSRDVAGIQELS